jgi:hypothetical protein
MDVRVDDPASANVLGLFLASALRRNLVERGKTCRLRGALAVDAEGMRAAVCFEEDAAIVRRSHPAPAVEVRGSLPALVRALARPGLWTLLRVRTRGNRLFALRALRLLAP